jgi:phosphoribosylanthranilate isomerase
MIIQIYEIQTAFEAEKCIDLGVGHIGSVLLSEDEWRIPELKDAIMVSAGTDTKNSIIPLFQDVDTIYSALDYYRPDFVHFCNSIVSREEKGAGLEKSIGLQTDIRKNFPEIKIIRSIPVPRPGKSVQFPTLELAGQFEPVSDLFLVDTWLGKEPVEGFIGITGENADWLLAGRLVQQSEIPVILAGGLSPENVYDGIISVLPAGADSCTMTNAEDSLGRPIRFEKDFKKVANFVNEVRRAESEINEKRAHITEKLHKLRLDYREREASLPAHSIRPNQLLELEEMEEKIEVAENELKELSKVLSTFV